MTSKIGENKSYYFGSNIGNHAYTEILSGRIVKEPLDQRKTNYS